MDFVDGVTPLGVNRHACKQFVRVCLNGLEDVIVADQKVCLLAVEPAVLIVDPIHAEDHGLADMTRRAQFSEQIVEIFPVRFPWFRRRQFVFPQEEAKQRAPQHLRGDVAAVVIVR